MCVTGKVSVLDRWNTRNFNRKSRTHRCVMLSLYVCRNLLKYRKYLVYRSN